MVGAPSMVALAVLQALLPACGGGNEPPPAAGAGGTSAGTRSVEADDVGAGTSSGPPGECDGPGYAGAPDLQIVESFRARVIDQYGDSVANESIFLCGINSCYRSETDEKGEVTSVLAKPVEVDHPAFKVDIGFNYGEFAYLVSTRTILDLGTQRAVRLPAMGSGQPLVAGQSAESAGIRLDVAERSEVVIDSLTFTSEEQQQFRAARVVPTQYPEAVDASLNLAWIVAMTPVGTTVCPPARMTMPNFEGWAAGAPVDFYLHGTDPQRVWAPYGGWAKVAEGRVSPDAIEISTVGPGLPVLGTIGVRLRR